MVQNSDPAALPEGTIIDGRYRLARKLGRGGFAWVYEAEHTDLGRAAAVKLLDPPRGEAAAQFAERFMREARIVARLNHPNVVTVYDFGVHGPTGEPYLAMELLRGHDLEHELTTSGPRVAHAAGVVHKDLKPSNLLREVVTQQSAYWSLQSGRSKRAHESSRSNLFGTSPDAKRQQRPSRSRATAPAWVWTLPCSRQPTSSGASQQVPSSESGRALSGSQTHPVRDRTRIQNCRTERPRISVLR